ncbi:hypothetical protein G3480_24740 [Thiorhodococcus mannitoliphagus]|uniref:Uncharacterized protein n=1 Tax=Thiorhodococcus mannitoliphagus TaxID=329406 RepID=A0A6P1DZ04_9GAMM|nr:hypothetical protein [Thiorhodococcus mannitoliphagus]NEX23458.1 hypothetical protein [Thiorhodococcus mannitoliphagus]
MSNPEHPAPVSNLADDDMQAIPRALVRAARRAREIAAQTGTPLIISRAGQVVEYPVTDRDPEQADSDGSR